MEKQIRFLSRLSDRYWEFAYYLFTANIDEKMDKWRIVLVDFVCIKISITISIGIPWQGFQSAVSRISVNGFTIQLLYPVLMYGC